MSDEQHDGGWDEAEDQDDDDWHDPEDQDDDDWHEAEERIEQAKSSGDALLDLSDLELSRIPSLSGLENLCELVLSGNRLNDLPISLRQLDHLQELRASHNKFRAAGLPLRMSWQR